jgi:hypothetical protein
MESATRRRQNGDSASSKRRLALSGPRAWPGVAVGQAAQQGVGQVGARGALDARERPHRLGVGAAAHGDVHGGRQEVAFLPHLGGVGAGQELAAVEQGGVAHPPFGQGGAHVQEVGVDGRREPVGLGAQHPDPDKALEGFAMFALYQGEVCTCPSRALIQGGVYGDFLEQAVKRVEQIKQGHPLDTDT